MFRKLTLFWILSLIGTWEVAAQTREELVASSIDGGFPYMLVFEDSQGSSKRAAGIYVRGNGGEWDPAFLGKVLPKPVSGGVSVLLEMAAYSELHEVLVIRDGKIHLLNVRSREKDSQSFFIFGERNAAVKHPVSGDLLQIPAVHDVNDVSFFTQEVDFDDAHAQMILISVKSDRVPTGNGMTFAVFVEIKENPAPGEQSFSLLHEPVLLDWKYMDRTELSGRSIEEENETELISTLAATPFLKVRADDPEILKSWRELMKDFRDQKISLAKLKKGLTDRSTREIKLAGSYPYILSLIHI